MRNLVIRMFGTWGRMSQGWWLLTVLCLLVAIHSAHALVEDNEGWFQITGTGPIAGPLRAFVEVQPRIGENQDTGEVDMRALIVRGALGVEVLPHFTMWSGYGYTPTYNPDRDEHRIFQQALYDTKLGPFNFSDRVRLEERLLENAPAASLRFRNQARLAYPLPCMPSLSLVLADEVFFDLYTVRTAPVSGFDQNRMFSGVSQQLTDHIRLEVDYLNQVVNGRRGNEDTMRHSGFLQLAFTW